MHHKEVPLSLNDKQLQFLTLQNIYACSKCSNHLSAKEYRISNQFQGKYGVAYLMQEAFNVYLMPSKDVILMTGKHTTSDVKCKGCNSYIGWKYIHADNEVNFYKVNKYVLQKGLLKTIEYYKED